jgi:hypothetical protein
MNRPDPRAAGNPATATGKTAPAAPSGEQVPTVETPDSGAVEPRKFEVPYQASEGSARRVIVPVTFNDRVTVPMALDTGSPGMVVSFGLAARLGLFSADKGTLVVEASGIGGTARPARQQPRRAPPLALSVRAVDPRSGLL